MSHNRYRVSSKIGRLYIFNVKWGQREGTESEKLIYYCNFQNQRDFTRQLLNLSISDEQKSNDSGDDSEKNELQTAVNVIGLCEALIKFVKNFGEDEEVDACHGLNIRLKLKEIEPNYWVAMSLSIPLTVIKNPACDKESRIDSPAQTARIVEYQDDELNDYYIKLLIEQIYETFFLHHGRFNDLFIGNGRDYLRSVCDKFFNWYLPTLKISTINLIELFGAIQYLPLEKTIYMKSQSFINHILTCDTRCRHALFLYNEQLISSSLDLRNTRVIYRHLISTVIPEIASEDISQSVRSMRKSRFIQKNIPIYCEDGNSVILLRMSLYRSINGSTVVLLFSEPPGEEIFGECDSFMYDRLNELTDQLGDISIKINSNQCVDSSVNDLFRFAYFNGSNAAFKSNSGFNGILDHRRISDADYVKLIIDIKSDLLSCLSPPVGSNLVEIVAKTTNESWLVVHECDARTLFSLLNHKNANLVEASETVKNYLSKQFKNMLFID